MYALVLLKTADLIALYATVEDAQRALEQAQEADRQLTDLAVVELDEQGRPRFDSGEENGQPFQVGSEAYDAELVG